MNGDPTISRPFAISLAAAAVAVTWFAVSTGVADSRSSAATRYAEAVGAAGGPTDEVTVLQSVGGTLREIAGDGKYLFVGVGSRVGVFEVTASGAFPVGWSEPLLAQPSDLVYRDDLLFVAAGSRLVVLNVADRSNPVLVGDARVPGQALSVALRAGHVFVGTSGSNSIRVLEIDAVLKAFASRDPVAPAATVTAGSAEATVTNSPDTATPSSTFEVVTPEPPFAAATEVPMGGAVVGLAASGHQLAVMVESGVRAFIYRIDIVRPDNPVLDGVVAFRSSGPSLLVPRQIKWSGDYVYSTGRSGLHVADLASDPPTIVGATTGEYLDLEVTGENVWGATGDSLHRLDLSQPDRPLSRSGCLSLSASSVGRLVSGGLVAAGGVLFPLDESCEPEWSWRPTLGQVTKVERAGDHLFVLTLPPTFSQVESQLRVGWLPLNALQAEPSYLDARSARDIHAGDDRLFIHMPDGVAVVDTTSTPRIAAHLDLSNVRSVDASGRRAVVLHEGAIVSVIDAEVADQPEVIDTLLLANFAFDVAIHGDNVFALGVDGVGRPRLVMHTLTPRGLVERWELPVDHPADFIEVLPNEIVVVYGGSLVSFVDVSPRVPHVAARSSRVGLSSFAYWNGRVVGASRDGLYSLALNDGEAYLSSLVSQEGLGDIAVVGDELIAAGSITGLQRLGAPPALGSPSAPAATTAPSATPDSRAFIPFSRVGADVRGAEARLFRSAWGPSHAVTSDGSRVFMSTGRTVRAVEIVAGQLRLGRSESGACGTIAAMAILEDLLLVGDDGGCVRLIDIGDANSLEERNRTVLGSSVLSMALDQSTRSLLVASQLEPLVVFRINGLELAPIVRMSVPQGITSVVAGDSFAVALTENEGFVVDLSGVPRRAADFPADGDWVVAAQGSRVASYNRGGLLRVHDVGNPDRLVEILESDAASSDFKSGVLLAGDSVFIAGTSVDIDAGTLGFVSQINVLTARTVANQSSALLPHSMALGHRLLFVAGTGSLATTNDLPEFDAGGVEAFRLRGPVESSAGTLEEKVGGMHLPGGLVQRLAVSPTGGDVVISESAEGEFGRVIRMRVEASHLVSGDVIGPPRFGSPASVAVDDGHVYATWWDFRMGPLLEITPLDDIRAHKQVALNDLSFQSGVWVGGDVVYYNEDGRLGAVDLRGGEPAVHEEVIDPAFSNVVTAMHIRGDAALIASWDGFGTFDVSDPLSLEPRRWVSHASGLPPAVIGDLALLSTFETIEVFRLPDLSADGRIPLTEVVLIGGDQSGARAITMDRSVYALDIDSRSAQYLGRLIGQDTYAGGMVPFFGGPNPSIIRAGNQLLMADPLLGIIEIP